MRPNVDAVVFDLDGTLINLGGFVDWKNAQDDVSTMYLQHGCDKTTLEAWRAKGLWTMLEEMYRHNSANQGEQKAIDTQEAVYKTLSRYEMEGTAFCTKMPGCLEALDWVKNRGIPMGVCTRNSQKAAEETLRKEGIAHYFEAVVGCTTRHRMKPHPDQLQECYRTLKVKPSRGVVVGDSHTDVIMGKAVGSYVIAVPMYFSRVDKMKEAGVDMIIDSLLELPEALLSI